MSTKDFKRVCISLHPYKCTLVQRLHVIHIWEPMMYKVASLNSALLVLPLGLLPGTILFKEAYGKKEEKYSLSFSSPGEHQVQSLISCQKLWEYNNSLANGSWVNSSRLAKHLLKLFWWPGVACIEGTYLWKKNGTDPWTSMSLVWPAEQMPVGESQLCIRLL